MPTDQFVVEAWLDPGTRLEVVATSCNADVGRAAFEAAKKAYSVRLTFRDRMSVLAERPDTILSQKKGQAG